jgi:predicted Zn-dependent protease
MRLRPWLLSLLVAACAAPEPAPVEQPPQPSVPAPPAGEARAPVKENIAIAGLVESARSDAEAGRFNTAAASLERALRLEPRNPRLWQELARVRLKQGDYAQAENLAARSTGWAASDAGVRADNWRIIAQAREARGDHAGAQAAMEQAARMGH